MASERCAFEFDPKAWEREHNEYCFVDLDRDQDILTENINGDVVWRCPHERVNGEDKCVFHLPRGSDAKPNPEKVSDAFLEIVNCEREAFDGDGPRPAQFIQAKFESLDLDAERVGNGRTIDLRYAEFRSANWEIEAVKAGSLDVRRISVGGIWDCESVLFGADVDFSGAKFDGKADFNESKFGGSVNFSWAEFNGNTDMAGAEFVELAGFEESKFRKRAMFIGAEFGGATSFRRATFCQDAVFYGVEFSASGEFRETHFKGGTWFGWARFNGEAEFSGTNFDGYVDFSRAKFEGRVTFTADGWFPVSQFQGEVDFSDVTADGPVRFVDEYDSPTGQPHTFLGEVDFTGSVLPDSEFSEVSFRQPPNFENADLTRADFSDSTFEGAIFEGADLTRANLSDASVAGANFEDSLLSQASLYGTDITNAALYGARMEGVHASDHTDFGVRNQPERQRSSPVPFRGPWPGVRYDPRNPEYDRNMDDKEDDTGISNLTRAAAIYAAIERVADANADSELASRCYLWRKDMQRKRYWSDEGRGNRSEPIRWFRSWLANVFVRYGESPWRVTGIAGLLIVGCAVLYYLFDLIEYSTSPSQSALLSAIGRTVPNPDVTFLDALYFSTLTFSTLGMGTFQPSGQWGRVLTIFETLSGVVLLALLVFVFGRRATR